MTAPFDNIGALMGLVLVGKDGKTDGYHEETVDVHSTSIGRYKGVFHFALTGEQKLRLSFLVPISGWSQSRHRLYRYVLSTTLTLEGVAEVVAMARNNGSSVSFSFPGFIENIAGAERPERVTFSLEAVLVDHIVYIRSVALDLPADDAAYLMARLRLQHKQMT
jgi:hypothetical protein